MNRHLVTIEVSIVSTTSKWVQTNRRSLNKNGLKSLNRETVKSRSTVKHNRVPFRHLSKDIPNFGGFAVDHFLSRTNSVAVAKFFQTADDERLKKSQGHLLRKTTLVQFKFRPNHDHRTPRVIDAFAEEVLTETSTLTFEHVRKRLKRPVSSTRHGAAMTTVIKESINSLLEHALLVADDDLGSLQLHEVPETIVPINDTTIEVV